MKIKITLLLAIIVLSSIQKGNAQGNYLSSIGQTDSIYSGTLEEQRIIWLQFPENYNHDAGQEYPVIFLLDGGDHLEAVKTVIDYYWGGFVPEMVIVAVSNRTNRTRDLTTSEITKKHGFDFNEENGGAEKFMQFISEELIPYVERKYPVTSYRTLIGHSYGGLFVINALINHTELFANYIAIDPSLDWDNQKLLRQADDLLPENSFAGKSLFLSLSGQLHMQDYDITIDNVMQDTSEYTLFARSNLQFRDLVNENPQSELMFKWKFYENDLHGTIPLPSILDGLIYLFNWYPIEGTDKFNDPETPTEELIDLIRAREMNLKEHFGYFVPPFDEELFNMLGYMYLDMEKIEKSKAMFQICTEYFPSSANAFDSLADFYVSQKDYNNALKYVTRAFEISGSDYHKQRIEEFKTR